MARINLKSLISRKKGIAATIAALLDALGGAVAIEDAGGHVLAGSCSEKPDSRRPVVLEEEILGWVSGADAAAAAVAAVLSHLAAKEAERKTLGNEVLTLYREINLIYNFSEKVAAAFDPVTVAQMALDEASHLIEATGGAVMVVDDESRKLHVVASFGHEFRTSGEHKLHEIVVGNATLASNAEIINEIGSSVPLLTGDEAIHSLIYAPLRGKEQDRGLILLLSRDAVTYTAGDLKLLSTIAAQTALAIENSVLHEQMVREATRKIEERRQELEIAVQERTAELAKQKENIELLSEIGKEITASLDSQAIFDKVYVHMNQLADADIFGVGIYDPDAGRIEYRLAVENGKKYRPYTRSMTEKNQFAVWCIENRKPVFINDVEKEYSEYISAYTPAGEQRALEDGTVSRDPLSLIYLPLLTQDKVVGVITIQSFKRNAYTQSDLNLLQNLAAYTAIAHDNADAYRRLNALLEHLKTTQAQLLVQEKMASLGQLTAGIAHEIKNPLNFVNNFAALSQKVTKSLRQDLTAWAGKLESAEIQAIEENLGNLDQMNEKIREHGKRADNIVHSMLQHSRKHSGERQPADINALLEEDLNLAYHSMRAKNADFQVAIEKDLDESVGKLEVVPQDLSRVFLNIITNALYEADKQRDRTGADFTPTLRVKSKAVGNKVEVRIRDNGNGIPAGVQEKLFEPFFTTKPTGEGTGLGLSISYDIVVQEHQGQLTFDTKEGEFTEFIICLPRNGR